MLYLELASRLGIPHVFGAPLPGKFMVAYRDGPEGELKLLDVFERGKTLTVEEAALQLTRTGELDESFLQPATKKSIILRMLRNLLGGALDDESSVKESLPYLDLLLSIDPQAAVERLTRARMNQRLGHKDAAARDVEWLMENFPQDGPDQLRLQLEQWLDALR